MTVDPIIIVAVIGFAGQIGTGIIGLWLTRLNHQAINANTEVTQSTHKLVDGQRTMLELRIEKLEELLMAANVREAKGNK